MMKSLALLALVAGVVTPPLAGQRSATEVRAAVDAIRERGRSSRAADLLSGERGDLSPHELDALADELVGIAVAFDGTGSRGENRAASAALVALVNAAAASRSVPYPGAFDRIKRIYEESPEVGIRAAVLMSMTSLPNAAPAIAFMESVATSNTIEAADAIRHLGFDMGATGVASLRRLYQAGTVVQYTARKRLGAFAASKGWERPGGIAP